MIGQWRDRQARKLVEYVQWNPDVDTLVLMTERDLSEDETRMLREQFHWIVKEGRAPRIGVICGDIKFVVVRGGVAK